jgi:hypothetical protein
MKKFQFRIMLLVLIIIVFSGILKINVEYHKKGEKGREEAIYTSNNTTVISKENFNLYSEINLSQKYGKKIKIYYREVPFDLRFDFGNYVMYINDQVYNNIVDKKDEITSRLKEIISNSIRNIKAGTISINDSLKNLVFRRYK